jgi:anti-anti-sigma factor
MEELKAKQKSTNVKIDRFEERLKNRFSVEGNSLLGSKVEFSNLFEKNNNLSDSFSILKIKFERATLREASSFKKFMETSIAEDGRSLIIDLDDCEFVDSSFFGVLVAGVKRMRAMDKKFYVVYNSDNRLPIFTVTGLDKVFTVFNTMEEAINS